MSIVWPYTAGSANITKRKTTSTSFAFFSRLRHIAHGTSNSLKLHHSIRILTDIVKTSSFYPIVCRRSDRTTIKYLSARANLSSFFISVFISALSYFISLLSKPVVLAVILAVSAFKIMKFKRAFDVGFSKNDISDTGAVTLVFFLV